MLYSATSPGFRPAGAFNGIPAGETLQVTVTVTGPGNTASVFLAIARVMHQLSRQTGFSLIEMIIVISITAIVGAMVATFCGCR